VRRASLLIVAAAAIFLVGVPAWAAVRIQDGLVAKFDGGIHPSRLPRDTSAPVAVHVGGGIEKSSAAAGPLPQLRRITVAINKQGQIFDRGLPTCRVKAIQHSNRAAALRCESHRRPRSWFRRSCSSSTDRIAGGRS
jgi:hypothetical protein